MNFNRDFFKTNGIFFFLYFVFLFIGLGLNQYYGRDELHLLINKYNNAFFDKLFLYFTDIAIPLFSIVSLYIIYKKYNFKTLLFLSSAFITSTVLCILVKRIFFEHIHRPMYYFLEDKNISIHIVNGVSESITYTFPSGHSASAFLVMLFLSTVSKNSWQQIFCFSIALLMAFSRVYLSKHFVIDTIGGASLGVFILTFFYYGFQKIHNPKLDKKIS